VGTIINDDAQFSITDAATPISSLEGTGSDTHSISFAISRTGVTTGAGSVQWQIVSPVGNTTNGSGDFASYADTVNFQAGETSKTVTVGIVADAISEADEPFLIQLLNAGTGASIDSAAAQKSVTILNDDIDQISVVANSPSLPEGNPSDAPYTVYSFTVSRLDPTRVASVNWSVDGSGAYKLDSSHFYVGTDNGYTFGTSGVVDFGVGETSKVVTVAVNTDAVGDFDRTFGLTLDMPSMDSAIAYGAGFAQAVIVNDDPALHVEMQPSASGDHHYLEGTSTGTLVGFKVIRTGSTVGVATANWQIQTDGTDGTNMADWGGYWPSGNVVFADGQSEKTVQVRISGDNVYESNEGFKVVLSNATNATLIDDHALSSGVVVNDDNGVSVTAQQASLMEGDSGVQYANFDFSVQGVAGKRVTAYYQVEGSGSVPANADDFESGLLPTGSVELLIGSDGTATRTVQVGVNGDATYGPDETFRLRITSVTNGSIAKASDEITIVNDDSLVSISPTAVARAEGNNGVVSEFHYTVTRSGDLTREAVVHYQVEGLGDNQATASDFLGNVLPGDNITFAAGQSSYDLVIFVNGDTTFESDESFAVRLTPLSTNDVGAGQNAAAIDPAGALARGVILNDDSAGLVVNGLVTTVTEGNSPSDPHYLSYEIVRNGDASQALTVNYTLGQDGVNALPNASMFVDGLSGSVTLAAGESRKVLNLQVVPNTSPGSDQHFVLSASVVGMTTLTAPVASTVLDDDSGITVHTVISSQLEGSASGTTGYDFVVERAGSNLGATDINWSLAGAGTNPANAADFANGLLPSGILHFAATQTNQIIHIVVQGDNSIEPDESYRVILDSSSDTTQKIQVASADAVIRNDDVVTPSDDLIYGSSGPNTLNGYGGSDTIYGGLASDMLFGGDGNDTLYGAGGDDQMYGGSGNDTLVINAANLPYLLGSAPLLTLDGGTGMDTVKLDGSGVTFDLTNLQAQIVNIEKLNINGSGANTLLLDQAFLSKQAMNLFNVNGDLNVQDDYHQLLVDGGQDDVVVIDLAGWDKQVNPWTYESQNYDVYVNTTTESQLLLKVGIVHETHL
jgi:hypothetical protein